MTSRPRHFALHIPAVLILGLLGCASTPGWKPGQPDDSTTQHYQLALTAIEAKDEKNAEAALQAVGRRRSDGNEHPDPGGGEFRTHRRAP